MTKNIPNMFAVQHTVLIMGKPLGASEMKVREYGFGSNELQ